MGSSDTAAANSRKIVRPPTDSKSSFVRGHILQRKDASPETLRQAWAASGKPANQQPSNHDFYRQKVVIKDRYRLNGVENIPRKKSGELNLSELIRVYMRANPDRNDTQIANFIANDGVTINKNLVGMVRAAVSKAAAGLTDEGSGDTGTTGAAVQKQPRVKRAKKAKIAAPADTPPAFRPLYDTGSEQDGERQAMIAAYEAMEDALDELMHTAEGLNLGQIASDLRKLRRRVGAMLVEA